MSIDNLVPFAFGIVSTLLGIGAFLWRKKALTMLREISAKVDRNGGPRAVVHHWIEAVNTWRVGPSQHNIQSPPRRPTLPWRPTSPPRPRPDPYIEPDHSPYRPSPEDLDLPGRPDYSPPTYPEYITRPDPTPMIRRDG